jgi:hypothetical protein
MPKLQMEQQRLLLNKTLQSHMVQPYSMQDITQQTTYTQWQFVLSAAVSPCTQSRNHTSCTTNVDTKSDALLFIYSD